MIIKPDIFLAHQFQWFVEEKFGAFEKWGVDNVE